MPTEAFMARKNSDKNIDIFTKVISELVRDAADAVAGVELIKSDEKKNRQTQGISVYFLQNEKITVDLYVNVLYSCSVPDVVSKLQTLVKEKIEEATRYIVHSVNVQVVSVVFPPQN